MSVLFRRRVLLAAATLAVLIPLSAAAQPTLCEAVDYCDVAWTTSGDANWFGQTAVSHDGVDAVQSGPIISGQSSMLETTVVGPAVVSFYDRVASEGDNDFLIFAIGGVEQYRVSGDAGLWSAREFFVPSGPQTLVWGYASSAGTAPNTVWVDEFTVCPADGTASIYGIVNPADAVAAGAMWQIDGGPWNAPDAVVSVPAGVHVVTFSNIGAPWNTPPSRTVILCNGETQTVEGDYRPLCEGVGACNRDWTTAGDAGWFVQNDISHDGWNACQSGPIIESQSSQMSTTVTGPATISFWWKVSSEEQWDRLQFIVDSSVVQEIDGEEGWLYVERVLPEGAHTLTWNYYRDNVNWQYDGYSAGWVDQFLVTESVPPTGTVTVNGGAPRTNTPNVLLDLTWLDEGAGVTGMRFSNNGATWSAWQKPASTKVWALDPGDGVKTVRAQFRDKAGNVSVRYTDTILLDQTPPDGAIVINNGGPTTDTLDVVLHLFWVDHGSGVSRMRFSSNGYTWSAWEPVASTKPWTLPGWGYHTLRVQYLDRAGNASPVFRWTIKAVE